MTPNLPASSQKCCDTRPQAAVPKDRAAGAIPADRPIDHHVAGHQAVHPDKPGRPRNDRTHRNRKPSQPLTPQLDNGPGSDKQHAHPDRASPIDAEDDPPAIAERDPAAASAWAAPGRNVAE
jgi:hypothetical protein